LKNATYLHEQSAISISHYGTMEVRFYQEQNMYLYLFWLFPALIFLLFFMSDRRRLFNAYLFSINLGLLLLISAFLLVVRTELWFNQQIAMIVFVVISILVFLSIIFSSLFLLFNGRQMISFEGKRLANLLSLLYGIFIIGALALGAHQLGQLQFLTSLKILELAARARETLTAGHCSAW